MAALGARRQIAYVVETVIGTTPATPSLISLPATGLTLVPTADKLNPEAVLPDRMRRPGALGNIHRTGDLSSDLYLGVYDNFFASAMNNSWVANVLKSGNTPLTFTIEDGHPDVDVYTAFKGVQVNSFTLTVALDGKVTVSFGLIGRSHTSGTTPLDADVPAPTFTLPITHFSGSMNLLGEEAGVVTGITLTYTNQATEDLVLFSRDAEDIDLGQIQVSGTLTTKLLNLDLYDAYINTTSNAIDFTLLGVGADAAKGYNFNIPNLTFGGYTKTSGQVGAVIENLSFDGYFDGVSNSDLVITRMI